MKSQVLEEKSNPMMRRKEYWVLIEHAEKATPPRKEILGFLTRELKAGADLIIVDKMFSEKGRAATRVRAEVYSKKEDMPRHKLEKAASRLEKKATAEKKPEKQAEKPPAAKQGG